MPPSSRITTIKQTDAIFRTDLAILAAYVYQESFLPQLNLQALTIVDPDELEKFRRGLYKFSRKYPKFDAQRQLIYYLQDIKNFFELKIAGDKEAEQFITEFICESSVTEDRSKINLYIKLKRSFDSAKGLPYYTVKFKEIWGKLDNYLAQKIFYNLKKQELENKKAEEIYNKLALLAKNSEFVRKFNLLQETFDQNKKLADYKENIIEIYESDIAQFIKNIFELLSKPEIHEDEVSDIFNHFIAGNNDIRLKKIIELHREFNQAKKFEYYKQIIRERFQDEIDQFANNIYEKLGKLDLNRRQLKKYQRLQFTFDQDKGFDFYKLSLQAAFKVDEVHARKIFDRLSYAHPQGVDIWVNPNPGQDPNKIIIPHPLIENTALLSLDSIFSSASKILNKMKGEQQAIFQQYLDAIKDKTQAARLERKYQHILATIELAYLQNKKEIEKLYQCSFKKYSETELFWQVCQLIENFQSYTVAQLAVFDNLSTETPNIKNYKRIFQQLNKEEQSIKYNALLQGSYSTEQDKIFNRDIFSLDIVNQSGDNCITNARMRYYDRHYYVTPSQLKLLQSQQKIKIKNPYAPQPTATAHSPDHYVSNFALFEEGEYVRNGCRVNPQAVSFFASRYGSPSPSEHYKIKYFGLSRNKHETTYYSFLNMEQVLHTLRVKTIASILLDKTDISGEQNIPWQAIEKISQILAYHVTSIIHDRNFRKSNLTDMEALTHAWEQTMAESNNIILNKMFAKNIFNNLTTHLNDILYIKNIHNHLITPAGLGSFNSKQRYYFHDSRIAQYATIHSRGGYLYMANGLDMGRYFNLDNISTTMHGNNCVALVELYRDMNIKLPILPEKFKTSSDYYTAHSSIINASKEYINYLEQFYIPQQNTCKQIQSIIDDKSDLLKRLIKLGAPKQHLDSLKCEIQNLQTNLIKEKKYLAITETRAEVYRTQVKQHEKQLYQQSKLELLKITNYINHATFLTKLNQFGDSRDPEDHTKYLAWKAFKYVLDLFKQPSGWFGFAPWKLSANNGLMQALIQITAELAQIFASSGCKSANDRELLLALILSKITELKEKSHKLDFDKLKTTILQDSQAAFAWHISSRQTALDRSAIPKTGSDMMQYAARILEAYPKDGSNATSYAGHTQFEILAAHKRLKEGKTITQQKLTELSRKSFLNKDSELYVQWRQNKWFMWGVYKTIDRCLLDIITERGLSDQELLGEYMALQQLCETKQHDDAVKQLLANISARVYMLNTAIAAEANNVQLDNLGANHSAVPTMVATMPSSQLLEYGVAAQGNGLKLNFLKINHTRQYKQLKLFFDLLKQFLLLPGLQIEGEGISAIRVLIKNYDPAQTSFQELLALFTKIRMIALTRVNDLQGRYNITFFSQTRPPWLQEFYKKISQANLNDLNFKVSEILDPANISELKTTLISNLNQTDLKKSWEDYANFLAEGASLHS